MRSWRNWQTHQLEGLAVAIPWWFESTRPHTFSETPANTGVSLNLKDMHPGAREQSGAAGCAWECFLGLTVNDMNNERPARLLHDHRELSDR